MTSKFRAYAARTEDEHVPGIVAMAMPKILHTTRSDNPRLVAWRWTFDYLHTRIRHSAAARQYTETTMTGTTLLFDPTAHGGNQTPQLRRTLDALTGSVVGFIDNAKPNFNHLVEDIAQLLIGKYGVRTVIKRRKRGASIPADASVVKELASQCDVVITGSGD